MPHTHRATQIQHCLDQIRAGQERASAELLELAYKRLQLLAQKMLRSFPGVARWEESDDIANEAASRLYQSLGKVRIESQTHFFNLAATQTRRVLIDLARRYSNHQAVNSANGSQAMNEPADREGEPASLMEWTEFHEQVEALPAEEREVVNLLWYHGLSREATAEALGITDRTVRRRWRNARFRLCKAMMGESLPE